LSMELPSRTSAPTPALDQTYLDFQIILGKVRPFTSPGRGPSTGSDHCSTLEVIRHARLDRDMTLNWENAGGRGRYRTADRWCVKLPCSVPTVSAGAGDVDKSWWRVPAVSPRLPFHGLLLRVMAHSWHTRGLDSQLDPKTHLSKTRRRSVREDCVAQVMVRALCMSRLCRHI
jgi:hypothetical protein